MRICVSVWSRECVCVCSSRQVTDVGQMWAKNVCVDRRIIQRLVFDRDWDLMMETLNDGPDMSVYSPEHVYWH